MQKKAEPASPWLALAVMMPVGLFNFMDRTLISILQIPIKAELHLSDTQLGLILGMAFAVIYTVFGLPAGWIADRTSRKAVLTWALAIWTGLTALTGFATGFVTLLICRMGVALGEAACGPVTASLISDLFPQQRRSGALALWALSLPLGTMLGFLLGGWFTATLGWRATFMAIGAGGAILVPLMILLFREPVRGRFDLQARTGRDLSLAAIGHLMWRTRSYRLIAIGTALHLVTVHASNAWTPQFFSRVHHLPVERVGLVMALVSGLGGGIGMAATAFLSHRLIPRDPRWYVWLPAGASALLVPATIVQLMAGSLALAVAAAFVASGLLVVFYAPLIAATQSVMPPQIRTFTGGFYVFFGGIVSMTVGPLTVGVISDMTRSQMAGTGVTIGLGVATIGTLLSIPVLLASARPLRADLGRYADGLVQGAAEPPAVAGELGFGLAAERA